MFDNLVSVDLDAVEEFVKNEKFTQFLLANFTEIGEPAFILDSILTTIKVAREESEKAKEEGADNDD